MNESKTKRSRVRVCKNEMLMAPLGIKIGEKKKWLVKANERGGGGGGGWHMTLKKKLLNPPVELTVFYWPIPNEFSQHCRVVWCHSQCLCLSAFYLKCDYIVKLTTLTFKSQHGNEKKNLYYHLFALVVLSLTGNCRKQWKDKRTWAENMIVLLFYRLQNVQKSKCSSLLYL